MPDEKESGESTDLNDRAAEDHLLAGIEQMLVPEEWDSEDDLGRVDAVLRPLREPQPWHRPRKQYVRRSQWLESLSTLIADEKIADRVNYLGLPGDEFLDVRYLAEGPIAEAGIEMRFLGFNDSLGDRDRDVNSASQNSALDDVRSHRCVAPESDVQPDDIRRIADPSAPAHEAVSSWGPFDVINLDLTQSIFAKPTASMDTYAETVRQLLGLQVGAKRDWLLWLTTRVDRSAVAPSQAASLKALVSTRFDSCGWVADDWHGNNFDSSDPTDIDIASCSDRDFSAIVSVGLGIWLSDLAYGSPEQRCTVTSSFGYRVKDSSQDAPDMVSYVVRFKRQSMAAEDRSGITPPDKSERAPDHCERLSQITLRHQKMVDVDHVVSTDNALRQKLVNETAVLLQSARVDVAGYRGWVSDYQS